MVFDGAGAGACLACLTVSGFRGIGPESQLTVQPRPGLTLVTGRNGSGKSSFAEALEVLLTGTLPRRDPARPAVFRDSWQNEDTAAGTEITADLLIEDQGHAIASRTWPRGAGIGDSQAWLQTDDGKRQPGLGGLGWTGDLKTRRPFFSHAELETFIAAPQALGPLRQLTLLAPPPDDGVSAAVNGLSAAAAALDAVAGTSAEQSRNLARLLGAALRHHETHGDGTCPVCGQPGALTSQWQEDTRRNVARLREEARAAEDAVARAIRASAQARAVIGPPPPLLAEDIEGVDLQAVRAAWRAWATRPAGANIATPAGLRALAGHMVTAAANLAEAVTAVVAVATAELSRRDGRRTPPVELGMLSQGEINVLVLSAFLSQATKTDSPFRFLVIDEPAPAMDLDAIDDLARALADAAATRQVIVFTHDSRLAAAASDLPVPATTLELTRHPGSKVDVRPVT